MKRDDDLLRCILMEAEQTSEAFQEAFTFLSATDEDNKRSHHLKLLQDASFIVVIDEQRFFDIGFPENAGRSYYKSYTYRLTNAGHDYLVAIRSDTIWKKTKDSAAQVGGMTLGMMRDLAIAYAKQELKGKLGIDLA